MSDSHGGLRRGSTLWLTLTALLMGFNIVLSMSVFSLPVPGGHLYFCDVVINLAAVLLDPLAAFLVGGVGSFLGDFFFYPAPMFVSLAAHGLQALTVSLIFRHVLRNKPLFSAALGVTAGSLVMVILYSLGRAYVYSTPEYAILKLPFEFMQAGVGAVLAMLLLFPMRLLETFHREMH